MSAEFAQLLVEMFVAAIDVINAAHFRNSVGFQSRQHERGRRAQIARHHRRARQFLNAGNDRGRTFQLHMRAHALQLGDVHVTLRENIFRYHADAVGSGKQCAHLSLHVSRKTRIWLRHEFERLRCAVRRNGDGIG